MDPYDVEHVVKIVIRDMLADYTDGIDNLISMMLKINEDLNNIKRKLSQHHRKLKNNLPAQTMELIVMIEWNFK